MVSVTKAINEPRYPSFKNIMAAKKKPLETLDVAALGLDPAEVGLAGAWSAVEAFEQRPPRQGGVKITDEGDGATKIADYLVGQKML